MRSFQYPLGDRHVIEALYVALVTLECLNKNYRYLTGLQGQGTSEHRPNKTYWSCV